MSRRAQDNLVAVLLLLFFIGIIYLCQDFGTRARMIPLPLAVFGIILTLVQLVWQNIGSTDDLQMEMISVSEPEIAAERFVKPAAPRNANTKPWQREAGACGMVALFVVMVLAAGPMPAVFVFTAGYFLLSRQYSWKAGLVYTALFTAAIYLLFGVALGLQPYHGLLAPWFA